MSKLQFNKKAGLYYRLSKDDERIGESLSIGNQDGICQGVFLQKLQTIQKMHISETEQLSKNESCSAFIVPFRCRFFVKE